LTKFSYYNLIWIIVTWGLFIAFGAERPEYEKRAEEINNGHTLAWSRHITGQDPNDMTSFDKFLSVACIPGRSTKANGDTRQDDEVWVIVKRTIDGNDYTFIECFQSLDWGEDNDYAWFVDCALAMSNGEMGTEYIIPDVPETPETLGDYPTLRTTTNQADPGLVHDIPISTYVELQAINDDKIGGVWGYIDGNYYLTNDIDASASDDGGQGFAPLGGALGTFEGDFDGCGYTISNLYMNRGTSNFGLFSTVMGAARIANVTMENINFINGDDCGALAGLVQCDTSDILIQNCHSSGNIANANYSYDGGYGGLIGVVLGTADYRVKIYDCSSSVDIDVSQNDLLVSAYDGGFASNLAYCDVSNCFATGSITRTPTATRWIGGFAGIITIGAKVEYCYATGDVEATDTAGGFAGEIKDNGGNWGDMYVRKCYSLGNVNIEGGAGTYCGGFTGLIRGNNTEITDCYSWGDSSMATGSFCGGFVGSTINDPNIYQVYSIGVPEALTRVGGLLGGIGLGGNPVFSDTYWDTETSGFETSAAGIGHTTTWLKTNPNYPDTWDFDNIWYQEYTPWSPAVPGYTFYINDDWSHLNDLEVCVFADGRPVGNFKVVEGELEGLDEDDYETIIAGINYYSIFESFPLVIKDSFGTTIGKVTNIEDITVDFYESMGAHIGSSMDYSADWKFSEDDFATKIEPFSGWKYATFLRSPSREPGVYIWEWEPIPLTIRAVNTKQEITLSK